MSDREKNEWRYDEAIFISIVAVAAAAALCFYWPGLVLFVVLLAFWLLW